MSDEQSAISIRRSERILTMSSRRPKIRARRSGRLNQLLSIKTPLKRDSLPESANKSDQFSAKKQSNSEERNSVEIASLFTDAVLIPTVICERLKTPEIRTISMEGLVIDQRKSLRSFKKFCSKPETEIKTQKISKHTFNCTKSVGKNSSNAERKLTSNVPATESILSDNENLKMTDRRSRQSTRSSDRISRSSSRNTPRSSGRISQPSTRNTPKKKDVLTKSLSKSEHLKTKRKTKYTPRSSGRISQASSRNTPKKTDVLTKSSRKSEHLNTKRKTKDTNRNSVEVDSLPVDAIIPLDFKRKPTRKSLKRKNISFESFNESITGRRKSSRLCKKVCLNLETKAQGKKHTKADKENCSNKGQKTKLRTSDSGVLLNTLIDYSAISENTPLDDLLFVTSSRKKNYRDITESSGICSAHSSLTFSTPIQKSKRNGLNSWNNFTTTDASFKVPKTKRPRKNTLKHKRLVLNELEKQNLEHEDDILENINLTPFKVRDVDNESDISWNMPTPQCGFKVSPLLPKRTPVFKDCISPTELRISRKKAEEFMYRTRQRKKWHPTPPPEIAESKEPAKKIDVMERLSALLQTRKKLDRSLRDELTSEEERDDDYYSEEEESILNY